MDRASRSAASASSRWSSVESVSPTLLISSIDASPAARAGPYWRSGGARRARCVARVTRRRRGEVVRHAGRGHISDPRRRRSARRRPLVRCRAFPSSRRLGMTRPGTLGELRASGWVSRPVKLEVRENAMGRIAEGRPVVEGVVGFDDTVLPQLENALLAGARRDLPRRARPGQDPHDPLASSGCSTSGCRSSPASEINDDPYDPVSRHARMLVAERGDDSADRVGPPGAPLRREAGHARHLDRRPHRGGRPHQGRRGPLPLRRAHHPLRAGPAHQPRHLRRSTSCPTWPSASRSASSTSWRSATSRSAATRSACRST